MNEDVFNMEVRKFLKKVGVTSQREIETAVRAALANGSRSRAVPLRRARGTSVNRRGPSVNRQRRVR